MAKKDEDKERMIYVSIPESKMLKILEMAKAEGVTSRVKAGQLLAGAVK